MNRSRYKFRQHVPNQKHNACSHDHDNEITFNYKAQQGHTQSKQKHVKVKGPEHVINQDEWDIGKDDHDDRMRSSNKCNKITGVPLGQMSGKEKINIWLANSEDLEAFHETRSEPGECNNFMKKFDCFNSRRALRDDRKYNETQRDSKQVSLKPVKTQKQHQVGTGARPKQVHNNKPAVVTHNKERYGYNYNHNTGSNK